MPPVNSPLVFDSSFLGKLEQLYLLAKKLFRGERRAERRSRQIGSSLEFADYRNYVLGDDLRSVDWNIYGRLDRLFVKLFEQEQDLDIFFLIDGSASMRWRPEEADPAARSKLVQACRLAASLAYVGLANLDRVDLSWFGPALGERMGLARGKSQFHQALEFLRQPPELEGATRLADSFRSFVQRTRRRGLVIVLSDLFDPEGFESALSLLRYEQFEVQLIQVLDQREMAPEALGDLRLEEPETGSAIEITADEALLERYRQETRRFLDRVSAFCAERAIAYAQAWTHVPFEDQVLRVLRDGLILR